MSRASIKAAIKREVLIEAGYRCAVPTCRSILAIDLHHLVHVEAGGGNTAANLIALCPNCHALYHRGVIDADAIFSWKSMLVSLSRAFDTHAIDDLLFVGQLGSVSAGLVSFAHEKGRVTGGAIHLSRNEGVTIVQKTHRGLVLSGDGVLRFSRLIGAGLVDFRVPYTLPDIGEVRYEVFLTPKGRQILDAWMKGNRVELAEALGDRDEESPVEPPPA